MNSTKQFWSLFKFQTTINPFIWFMPVALGFPLYFSSIFSGSYHPGLSSLLGVQNLFFVGILGSAVIAPEKFQFGAANSAWSSGTEFLLTRAVSRPVLYRSKSALLYLLVLLIPLVSLLYSLKSPDLIATEYSDIARQLCLSHVPGSTLLKDPSGSRSPLISIPMGNVLVEEWHFWLFLASVAGVQALLLILYPIKRGILIFYILFIAFIFAPLFGDVHSALGQKPTFFETTFFFFAAHQLLFWISTALAAVLVQLWCERRFSQLEQ